MSQSPLFGQVFLNDGKGNSVQIQTGTWVSKAYDMSEKRRFSVTIGITGATGTTANGVGVAFTGGFTGTLYIQGTDEIQECTGYTGTPQAGAGPQPGKNGVTGALFWTTVPSGAIAITNSTTAQIVSLTDVGPHFLRLAFNPGVATAIGSGTMNIFVTGKNT